MSAEAVKVSRTVKIVAGVGGAVLLLAALLVGTWRVGRASSATTTPSAVDPRVYTQRDLDQFIKLDRVQNSFEQALKK